MKGKKWRVKMLVVVIVIDWFGKNWVKIGVYGINDKRNV